MKCGVFLMRNFSFGTVIGLFCLQLLLPSAKSQKARIIGNARVDRLLGQMTLDEKIAMIRGTSEDASTDQGEAGYLPGIKRLGIPCTLPRV
jgi:hypothetical protein